MDNEIKSSFQKYFWTTTWVIIGVALGIGFITIYNFGDEKIHYGSALVWAGALFVLGALAGFIFCVPKIVSAAAAAVPPATPPPTLPPTPPPVPPDLGAPAGPGAPPADAAPPAPPALPPAIPSTPPTPLTPPTPGTPGYKKIVQENTNLTQVSDWLTKVIIGAGLVQLKEIPPFIMKVATRMGRGISCHPDKITSADPAIILCAGIMIYFLSWGFASGYLIMRLIIAELLADEE